MLPPSFLNIFKPAGMTSSRVVSQLKRQNKGLIKKIGHIGTLDPFASGVLIIGINGAQRLNDYLHQLNSKTYLAVGKLGVYTETGDLTSEVVNRDSSEFLKSKIAKFDIDFLNEFLNEKFVGEYWQSPHHFSAAKFEGKPLHYYARQGIKINKEKVRREIYSLKVRKYAFPYLTFEVEVSSGTYIRSLFNDMARELGTVGTLLALSRISVGEFKINKAVCKRNWPAHSNENSLNRLMSLNEALPLPLREANSAGLKRLLNGNPLNHEDLLDSSEASKNQNLSYITYKEKIMALSEKKGDEFRVLVNFSQYYDC